MATTIPPALKAADIARFALRAGQLEKAKPIIAYWCNYWIVNQILAKKLHFSDNECMNYTVHLVDKLEQTKANHAEDDEIKNDLIAQTYVEQFGSETFQRAENAMKANKASRQTADTFTAAATFLELSQIWGPLEPEIASKVKFAKYHALRIVRAIKAGEDPNLSNQTPELSPVPGLLPAESDAQVAPRTEDGNKKGPQPHQPFVEDAVDEHDGLDPRLVQISKNNESLHAPRSTSESQTYQNPLGRSDRSSPPMVEDFYNNTTNFQVSPLNATAPNTSVAEEGGYFPKAPNTEGVFDASKSAELELSNQPPSPPAPSPYMQSTTPYSRTTDMHLPSSLHSFPPPPQPEMPPQSVTPHAQLPSYPTQPLYAPTNPPTVLPNPPPLQSQPRNSFSQPPIPPPTSSQTSRIADDEAMAKAQKHARFAISALNFEDVKTAVLELRRALDSLGAR